MTDPFGFNYGSLVRDQSKRLAPSELDRLEKGDVVTVSPGLVNGDCSYSYAVWEVLAVNETHARLRSVYGDFGTGKAGNEALVVRNGYRFAKAGDDFLNLPPSE